MAAHSPAAAQADAWSVAVAMMRCAWPLEIKAIAPGSTRVARLRSQVPVRSSADVWTTVDLGRGRG